ncbi:hypothetical protein V8C37DRAFT_340090 [Trichoderma ceciliae]
MCMSALSFVSRWLLVGVWANSRLNRNLNGPRCHSNSTHMCLCSGNVGLRRESPVWCNPKERFADCAFPATRQRVCPLVGDGKLANMNPAPSSIHVDSYLDGDLAEATRTPCISLFSCPRVSPQPLMSRLSRSLAIMNDRGSRARCYNLFPLGTFWNSI